MLDLTRYRFEGRELREAMNARRAVWRDGGWVLEDVNTTRFVEGRTEQPPGHEALADRADARRTGSSVARRGDTGASELWATRAICSPRPGATQPLLYFWQKMMMPLTMASLMLVAASFVFGPLRSVAAGTRVFYGVVTGLVFKYLQDLLGPASTVFGFSPAWAVLAPT